MKNNKYTIILVAIFSILFIGTGFTLILKIDSVIKNFNHSSPEEIKPFYYTEVKGLAKVLKKGGSQRVERYILAHPDIYIDTPELLYGNNLLMYTIYNNQLNKSRVLLHYGANPNHTNKSFETPLIIATKLKNYDALLLLCKFGADPNYAPGGCDKTAYRWGANDLAALIILVREGLDISNKEVFNTLLKNADNIDVIYYLICENSINADLKSIIDDNYERILDICHSSDKCNSFKKQCILSRMGAYKR